MSSNQINEPSNDAVSRIKQLEREVATLKNQLLQVEKDRDEYLQNVSHQIVAPLNAMKWHIENLTNARVGYERGLKVLRSVYSQATLAAHLAKNFKLMSNLGSEHTLASLNEPLQEVPLCPLLINLSDDFQPLAWEDDIQIGVTTAKFETTPPVLAMKPLISQVFSNILENAVKYSKKHTRITISGRYVKDNDSVEVSIRNLGIPLTNEELAHIFERGYRSARAKSKYPAGTGFGLYIARRIVELHEGQISASIEPDGSAVFRVVLTVGGLKGKARIRVQ
jgi:signal transduction histidine kinase